jgi:hypothetical protein
MAPVYLVGGAVRDLLLGIASRDYDYAVIAPNVAAVRRQAEDIPYDVSKPEYTIAPLQHAPYILLLNIPIGCESCRGVLITFFLWSMEHQS